MPASFSEPLFGQARPSPSDCSPGLLSRTAVPQPPKARDPASPWGLLQLLPGAGPPSTRRRDLAARPAEAEPERPEADSAWASGRVHRRSGTLTAHVAGAVLAHHARVVLLVRRPLVDEHGRVGGAGVQDDAVLGEGGGHPRASQGPEAIPCPTSPPPVEAKDCLGDTDWGGGRPVRGRLPGGQGRPGDHTPRSWVSGVPGPATSRILSWGWSSAPGVKLLQEEASGSSSPPLPIPVPETSAHPEDEEARAPMRKPGPRGRLVPALPCPSLRAWAVKRSGLQN